MDLSSSNSYLNGKLFGFMKILPVRPYFGLTVNFFTIIGLLVIFISQNKSFAPKH